MTITKKVIVSFIVLIALSLFSAIFVSNNILNIQSNVESFEKKDFQGIAYLLEADRDSYQSNLALLQIMNHSTNIEKTIKKGVEDNLLQVRQRFNKFKALLQVDMQDKQTEFNNFDTYHKLVEDHTSKIIGLIKSNDISTAREYYFTSYLQDYESMRDTMDFFTGEAYKSIETDKQHIADNIDQSFTLFIVMSLILIVVSIAMSILLSRDIRKSITRFQTGLLGFFDYLNKKTSTVDMLEVHKDEIGKMAEVVNENITITKKAIEQDERIIHEVKNVVSKVKDGHLDTKVQATTNNKNLEELKLILNEMLEVIVNEVSDDLNQLSKAFEEYQKLNFTYKIQNTNGKTAAGLNSLAQTITKVLVENKTNGLTLQNSANALLDNVNQLNNASSSNAASLEETAAAVEEITATVKANSENVNQMTSYAKAVTKAVHDGEQLANDTTVAMDDLDKEVSSINEAITVIDQIAFQTNILSLNAAVEAATAGEAGKGFAVVAQEVRNLASRSAEAANEIKALVESATTKASNGKIITDKMLKGYSNLNENIQKTISLIDNVSHASSEQQAGIEQINDTITSLDRQTQQNASISDQTRSIAMETQRMAESIVRTADEKEFEGKHTIKVEVKTYKTTSTPKPVQQQTKKEEKKIETKTKAPQKQTISETPNKIVSNNTDDSEWESF